MERSQHTSGASQCSGIFTGVSAASAGSSTAFARDAGTPASSQHVQVQLARISRVDDTPSMLRHLLSTSEHLIRTATTTPRPVRAKSTFKHKTSLVRPNISHGDTAANRQVSTRTPSYSSCREASRLNRHRRLCIVCVQSLLVPQLHLLAHLDRPETD